MRVIYKMLSWIEDRVWWVCDILYILIIVLFIFSLKWVFDLLAYILRTFGYIK